MQRTVVHWDIENVRVRRGVDASFTCNNIRRALTKNNFQMVQGLVYLDSGKENADLRSELSDMGWNIVDCCNKRGKAENVDKRIIANMCVSTLVYGSDFAVCLISKDLDFCFTLNTMRNVNIRTVIISEADQRLHHLLASSADVHLCVDFVPSPSELEPVVKPVAGSPAKADLSGDADMFMWACIQSPTFDGNKRLGASVGTHFHTRALAEDPSADKNSVKRRYQIACAELVERSLITLDHNSIVIM